MSLFPFILLHVERNGVIFVKMDAFVLKFFLVIFASFLEISIKIDFGFKELDESCEFWSDVVKTVVI